MNRKIDIAREYCSQLGWRYKDAGDFIIIGFDVNNLMEPIYIKQKHFSNNGNPIIEISYFGGDTPEDLIRQSEITTLLLKRNQTLNFGNWSIKRIAGDDAYEFKYNIEQQNLDSEKFVEIVGSCIDEIKYFKNLHQNDN